MPVGFFLMPYEAMNMGGRNVRGLEINFDQATLRALRDEGGVFHEVQCLGNHAVCKVRASLSTLSLIAALPGTDRFPKDLLDDPLSDLTVAQKLALRDRIVGLGYTLTEVQDALGPDIGSRTLRDVVRFIVSRSRPRFTVVAGAIVESPLGELTADGPVLIDSLDARV
jgi:hypothetical protein